VVKRENEARQGAIENLNLSVNGHQVHYLKAGSGPPVVLLHGGASDARDWIRTIAALSPYYSLYAPDLIGYGLSDKPKSGYYLSDFVEFMLGFTEVLGLDSSIMVGHSLGGRICLEIALRCPERIHKLVLVDIAGFGRISLLGGVLATAAWGLRKLVRRPQPYPQFLQKDGEDVGWFCLDELPNLTVPTLIVWNRFDPYFPLSLPLRAKELIPGARLEVLPGYGHAPHKQRGESFNGLLLSYLNGD